MKNKIVKAKEFIKKHDNIFVFMLILLSICGITLDVSIINSDELWNFQNIYKMYNGFVIYKDANVIITPLFLWLGELLFKVLGANFLVFRVYNIIIMEILYFVTYLTLKKLNINKKIAVIIILILITYWNYGMLLIQANYNTMALMFCLIGVLLNINKSKYNDLVQGVMLFLIFITKQNIGMYYGIGLCAYEILNKTEWKIKIKKLLIEFITFIILLTIFIIYFYLNNNLYNFINYTILGIKEFANENITLDIPSIILSIFFISINTLLTIFFIKNKRMNINKKEKEILILLNCFSTPLIFIVYPIFNKAHFLIGIYLSVITFSYLIKIMIKEIGINIKNKIINIILICCFIFTCIKSLSLFIDWTNIINNENYKIKIERPFFGGPIEDELIKNIDNVVEYMENEEDNVIVLSSKAAFYMITTKRSNGMMDLPFKGNLGKDGEEGLIREIENMYNTKILIEKNENELMWQESKKAREYIINNMKKIGEIEDFYIYTK